jgi:hypothetical protein
MKKARGIVPNWYTSAKLQTWTVRRASSFVSSRTAFRLGLNGQCVALAFLDNKKTSNVIKVPMVSCSQRVAGSVFAKHAHKAAPIAAERNLYGTLQFAQRSQL